MLVEKLRYSNILRRAPCLFDPAVSVLEVGCGAAGISQFLNRRVVGVEPNPVAPPAAHLEIVQASIMALPFADGAFDHVLCVDVLEHLPSERRAAAILELTRVAGRQLIISCPCHIWARAGDAALEENLRHAGQEVPGWLGEHAGFGLPFVQDILHPIIAAGHAFDVLGNETMLQHYAGAALHDAHPMAAALNSRLHHKSRLQPPFTGNEWDVFYSFMFTIQKSVPAARPLPAKPWRPPAAPRTAGQAWHRLRRLLPPNAARPPFPDQAIYAIYHKPFPTSHLGPIIPIYAGEAAKSPPRHAQTDRCLKTAGLANSQWSELSAIYKIWTEGPRTPVVGFCHYRRLLDFTPHPHQPGRAIPPRETAITASDLANGNAKIYDAELISTARTGAKIILARPYETPHSVFEHYCEAHSTNDYLELINYCAAGNHPLLPFFVEQFADHSLFANNLFVLSWDLFSELCGFWFEILGPIADKLSGRPADPYQQRDVAFLSERVFDAWVRYRRQGGTELVQLPILMFQPPPE